MQRHTCLPDLIWYHLFITGMNVSVIFFFSNLIFAMCDPFRPFLLSWCIIKRKCANHIFSFCLPGLPPCATVDDVPDDCLQRREPDSGSIGVFLSLPSSVFPWNCSPFFLHRRKKNNKRKSWLGTWYQSSYSSSFSSCFSPSPAPLPSLDTR